MSNPFDHDNPNQISTILDILRKPPRIVQAIQVCNEEELVEACILQVYDQVDKIIVVEGAVQSKVDAGQATKDGHSTDRTADIIKDVKANKDPDKKIIFVQIDRPWTSLEELKNTFFQYMQNGDWMLITDADEFVHPEAVNLLRRAINVEPCAVEFVPTFYHFWKDRRFIRNPARLGFGTQHQRFIKFQPGLHYQTHPVATDANGHCTYFSPHYLPRRFVLPGFDIFHYSYMNFKKQAIAEKKEYYKKELKDPVAHNERSEIDRQFFEDQESPDDLLLCDLEHPKIIRTQPWFNQLEEKLDQLDVKFYKEVEPYSLENPHLIWAWKNKKDKKGYDKLFNTIGV